MAIRCNFVLCFLVLLSSALSQINQQSPIINFREVNDSEEKSKLVQVFVFFRHGLYVPVYNFYKNEYAPYDIFYPNFEESTYVGNSQAWSMGLLLRKLYSSLLLGINSNEVTFVIGEYDRSSQQASHMYCGLVGNYPNWDYNYMSKTAVKYVTESGSCNECNGKFYVPVELIKMNSGDYENSTKSDEIVFDIQTDSDFFDNSDGTAVQHEFNKILYSLIEKEYGITVNEDEVSEVIENLISREETKNQIGLANLIAVFHSHKMHGLKKLSFTQSTVDEIFTEDPWEWLYNEEFYYMFHENTNLAASVTKCIISDVMENMYGYTKGANKLRVYMMHDNNLYGLLQLTKAGKIKYPDFSSNLRFLVYEDVDSEGETFQYVNLAYEGELFKLENCDINCPISEFYEILNGFINN